MGNNCFKQHAESEALRTRLGICPAEVNRLLNEQRKIYEKKCQEYVTNASQNPDKELATRDVETAQEAHIALNVQPCHIKLPAQNTQATQTESNTQSALPSQSSHTTQCADPTQTGYNVPATQSVQIVQNAHAMQGAQIIEQIVHTVPNVQATLTAPNLLPALHAHTTKNALTQTQVVQNIIAPHNSHAHLKNSTHCICTQNEQTVQISQNEQTGQIAQTMQTTKVALQTQTQKQFAVQRKQIAQELPTTEISQADQNQNEQAAQTAQKKCNMTQKEPPTNLVQSVFIYNSNLNSGEASRPKLTQDIHVNRQDATVNKKCQNYLEPRNAEPIVKRAQNSRFIDKNLPDAIQAHSEISKLHPNINNREKTSPQQQQQHTQIWRSRNYRNCSTCKMSFFLKIYECSDRHSSCSDCKEEGRACGICKKPISTLRSSTPQKMFNVKAKIVPCPNSVDGCVLHFRESEMNAHLKECPYQELPCPTGCPSILRLRQISSHFLAMHPEQHSINVGSEIHLRDISKNSKNVYLVLVDKIHFLFYVVVLVTDRRVYMAVQIISTKFSAMKWCYEVHVYNAREGRSFIFVDSCSSYFEPIADIFKQGKCCVIPLAYASNFVTDGVLTYKFFIKKHFVNN